ncbi:MAG: CotH kinase family protein, partial [Fidelibacterota bacterium]
ILHGQDHWETAIFAEDDWRYIVPSFDVETGWNTIEFDVSNWDEGPGGFGYADGDDGTIIDPAISVYFRRIFSISDLTKLSSAILSADYDDGFVAYLNGHEIGRSYNLSEPGTFVPYDETTTSDHEASLYNGGLPESFMLDSLELDSFLTNGENVFAVQIHNVGINSSDMSGNFYLSFGITDDSEFYETTPWWFQEPIVLDEFNLPIILIDTYGAEIPNEPRIPASMGIINNESGVNYIDDPFNDFDGSITIERRGNSSQWQGKTPYRFETVDDEGDNSNVELLGMPAENDWVLYAPWQDKTMIRNVLTYQLSNEMGRYASRSRHVELYLNDEYRGIYVLMEKIKRDGNRVDISKLNPDEITGDDVTGGYILKFDWFNTGDNIGGFESEFDDMIYNYHYPKPSDIVPEQEAYIQDYINGFETIMMGTDYTNDSTGYPSMMNVESFVDFILLQELAKNVDAYRLSTYIYKDKESVDNRLIAGPVWDINHGFGNCDYGETWEVDNWLLEFNPEGGDQMAFWWELLWEDLAFQHKAAVRYTELRQTIFSEEHIYSIIDSVADYLGPAVDRNFARWPLLGNYIWPNYYVFDTYEEEIDYLKSWTAQRLAWMDSDILLSLEPSPIAAGFRLNGPFPNPFNPSTVITYELPYDLNIEINIFNLLGRKVRSLLNETRPAGQGATIWDGKTENGHLASGGVYFISVQVRGPSNGSNVFYQETKKVLLLK